jgi:hypothetical protein
VLRVLKKVSRTQQKYAGLIIIRQTARNREREVKSEREREGKKRERDTHRHTRTCPSDHSAIVLTISDWREDQVGVVGRCNATDDAAKMLVACNAARHHHRPHVLPKLIPCVHKRPMTGKKVRGQMSGQGMRREYVETRLKRASLLLKHEPQCKFESQQCLGTRSTEGLARYLCVRIAM